MSLLRMERPDMANIPEANIPGGFQLRLIRSDEKQKWEELFDKAFGFENSFDNDNASAAGYVEDGVFVITDGADKFVAIGTALCDNENPNSCGVVYSIAVDPDYSGKKLGYEITAAVLRRIRDAGFSKAELKTKDFIFPAIKIYLDLGFLPDLTADETMQKRWENIHKIMSGKHNFLAKKIVRAEQGDADCQFYLGEYYHGKQDFTQALKWLTLAAEQDHPEALFYLAGYYGDGEVVEQNIELSIQMLTKSAELGHADAQISLAWHYAEGINVPQCHTTMLKWFIKAGEQDMPVAQYQVGFAYKHGNGVEPDLEEAVKWWMLAAEPVNSFYLQQYLEVLWARNALGLHYYCGFGGNPDYELAEKWYKKTFEIDSGGKGEAAKMLALIEQIKNID